VRRSNLFGQIRRPINQKPPVAQVERASRLRANRFLHFGSIVILIVIVLVLVVVLVIGP
jgi:hypothetical protein